jgi:AcrR family transcriptional regulator
LSSKNEVAILGFAMARDLELDGATPSTNGAPPRRAGGRLPHQLPSGRHGLPRSFVENNQRERILRAVVEVASETGYGALTVRDVIEGAGVSRRTFYDHFDNKEQAFLAAYHLVVGRLAVDVEEASSKGSTWCESIVFGLSTFLDQMARDPALAHLLVVEVLAAGPPALASRAAAMEAFRAFLEPGFDEAPEGLPVPALAAETAIGGAYEVVYSLILQGRTAELPALLPDLLQIVLLPFVGAQTAADQATAARRNHIRPAQAR